jgi:hypothetical protein
MAPNEDRNEWIHLERGLPEVPEGHNVYVKRDKRALAGHEPVVEGS